MAVTLEAPLNSRRKRPTI